jgi:hypothetical protein
MARKTERGQAVIELAVGLLLVCAFFVAAFTLSDAAHTAQRSYRFNSQRSERR